MFSRWNLSNTHKHTHTFLLVTQLPVLVIYKNCVYISEHNTTPHVLPYKLPVANLPKN